MTFKEGQGRKIPKRDGERVPDTRGSIWERPFACRFQVCFGNPEQPHWCRTERTRGLICWKQWWQVVWKRSIELKESKDCNFELNSKCDWKPVKLLQEGRNMIRLQLTEDKASRIVLNKLEPVQLFGRDTKKNWVAIIKTGRDAGMDKSGHSSIRKTVSNWRQLFEG